MSMTGKSSILIPPYGGKLVNLAVPAGAIDQLKAHASRLPSLQLSERSVCDLELLATGAFSPLDRFMGREDYRRGLEEMRLSSGHIFPVPVTLPVDPGPAIRLDRELALRNAKNDLLAIMTIAEIYPWDRAEAAQHVFGTQDPRHPLVAEMMRWGRLNISGPVHVLQLPRHYDFQDLRLAPAQVRARLETYGCRNVIAFQAATSLHRAHEELTRRAIRETGGVLLLQPIVGWARPGDMDHYTRVRAYKALAENYYDPGRVLLALLPLASRLAGPREALWHALIRRNYGANHLIVMPDHAGPDAGATGKSFYDPAEARHLVERFGNELGVKVIPFQAEAAGILAKARPPRDRQGVCIWLTGLSGAGKSTTAEILTSLLMEHGRQVTLLDGDVVRTHLSQGLDFSKTGRDINIRRIGFVAAEIVRHGGIVVCAAVSPYRATRNDVRNMFGPDQFVEVFVDTPLDVCEQRDVKGLYAKARRGEIKDFTGIDDPYEPPDQAELLLDTVRHTPEENTRLILDYLAGQGFIGAGEAPAREGSTGYGLNGRYINHRGF